MKQDGSARGREENRKHKLQQRFLCQRMGQRGRRAPWKRLTDISMLA